MDENDNRMPPDSPLLHRALEERSRQQLLDVLESPVRRRVLHELDANESRVELSDLAERVANVCVRGSTAAPSRTGGPKPDHADALDPTGVDDPADVDDETDRVAIQLHHVHLPKLDEYGLLKYDHRAKTVSPTVRS